MVDNIRIVIQGFTDKISLKYSRKESESENWVRYRLYSNGRISDNTPYLFLQYNESDCTIIIENSIRKWYYGENNLEDLTASDFEEAICRIAEVTNIKIEDLLSAKITQCEIGANIVLYNTSASKFLSSVQGFGSYERKMYKGTIYFNTKSKGKKEDIEAPYTKVLTLYNKGAEVLRHNSSDMTFGSISAAGINQIIRVEFKIWKTSGFDNAHISCCRTIGGMIENYDMLALFFISRCSDIVIQPELNASLFESEHMDNSRELERSVFDYLMEGYCHLMKNLDECSSEAKSLGGRENSIKSEKSQIKRLAKELIHRYAKVGSYTNNNFMADIRAYFMAYYKGCKKFRLPHEEISQKFVKSYKLLDGALLGEISYSRSSPFRRKFRPTIIRDKSNSKE